MSSLESSFKGDASMSTSAENTTSANSGSTTTKPDGSQTTTTGRGPTTTSSSTSPLPDTSSASSSNPPPPPATTEAPPPDTSEAAAPVVSTTIVVTSGSHSSTVVVQTTLPLNASPSEVASSNLSGGNHNNVGAIVGGTIGGLAALIALIALGYWLWRRRRRNLDSTFDGNFDPSTNRYSAVGIGGVATHSTGGGTLPNIPLDDDEVIADRRFSGSEIGGGIVTSPFTGWSAPNSPQMSQTHNLPPGALVMASHSPPPGSPHRSQFSVSSQHPPSAYADPFGRPSSPPQRSISPTGTFASHNSYAYPMAVPDRTGSASPPHSAYSVNGGSMASRHSRKDRDAFRVVNPDQEADQFQPRRTSGVYASEAYQTYLSHGPSPSVSSNPSSGVWVHSDSSRSNGTPSSGGSDGPPIYDSIPGNNSRPVMQEKRSPNDLNV
ncbi:hypothetical protein DL96DRAFT_1605999 [Flagelloscypha sp. PMI_526]|nr:hypothetical protein DL96DRAFT_1605999 [Flagelloscypha sp. PMI_526]